MRLPSHLVEQRLRVLNQVHHGRGAIQSGGELRYHLVVASKPLRARGLQALTQGAQPFHDGHDRRT